jgi:hypothetical protein
VRDLYDQRKVDGHEATRKRGATYGKAEARLKADSLPGTSCNALFVCAIMAAVENQPDLDALRCL